MNIILVLNYYVCHRYCRHVMEELLQTEVRLVADLKLILVSYNYGGLTISLCCNFPYVLAVYFIPPLIIDSCFNCCNK